VIALVIITLVGATGTLLVMQAAQMSRQRAADAARSGARAVLDSGVAYVRVHGARFAATQPAREVELPVDDLVPAPAKARLTLTTDELGVVHVRARVDVGRAAAVEEATIASGAGSRE